MRKRQRTFTTTWHDDNDGEKNDGTNNNSLTKPKEGAAEHSRASRKSMALLNINSNGDHRSSSMSKQPYLSKSFKQPCRPGVSSSNRSVFTSFRACGSPKLFSSAGEDDDANHGINLGKKQVESPAQKAGNSNPSERTTDGADCSNATNACATAATNVVYSDDFLKEPPANVKKWLKLEKHSDMLMEALNHNSGDVMLAELSKLVFLVVKSDTPAMTPSETAKAASGAVVIPSVFGNRLAFSRAMKKFRRRASLVGKIAVVMTKYQQEIEKKRRLMRIKMRWDSVRKICKTFLAVHSLLGNRVDAVGDSETKFSHYERLCSCLKKKPETRPNHDVTFMAEELALLKIFKEYDIGQKDREEICKNASLVVLSPGQVLFREGEIGQFFYVVMQGSMSTQVQEDLQKLVSVKQQQSRSSVTALKSSQSSSPIPRRPNRCHGSNAVVSSWRSSITSQEIEAKVRLIINPDRGEEEETTVMWYNPGEGFGGLAIQQEGRHTVRKASVMAEQASELLRIDARDYRRFILKYEQHYINCPLRFFETIPFFAMFNREELMYLALNTITRLYPAGALIMEQGRLVDDEHYFGLLKWGRCTVMQKVSRDGSEIPAAAFIQFAGAGIISSSQKEAQQRCESLDQRGGDIGNRKQWITHLFAPKLSGEILFHKALLGEHAVRHHTLTVLADTCVEVIFLPRKTLRLALRRNHKFKALKEALYEYPTKTRLRELVMEGRVWRKFQSRVVKQFLVSTPKGRIMLDYMADVKYQRKKERLLKPKYLRAEESNDNAGVAAPAVDDDDDDADSPRKQALLANVGPK